MNDKIKDSAQQTLQAVQKMQTATVDGSPSEALADALDVVMAHLGELRRQVHSNDIVTIRSASASARAAMDALDDLLQNGSPSQADIDAALDNMCGKFAILKSAAGYKTGACA